MKKQGRCASLLFHVCPTYFFPGPYQYDSFDRLVAMHPGDAASITFGYDAAGHRSATKGQAVVPFGFTGREYDEVAELYYYRARYYDATLGRFLTRDPEKPQLAQPLELNPYQYALNNPTRYVDPRGTAEQVPISGMIRTVKELAEKGIDNLDPVQRASYDAMRAFEVAQVKGEAITITIAGSAKPVAGDKVEVFVEVPNVGKAQVAKAGGTISYIAPLYDKDGERVSGMKTGQFDFFRGRSTWLRIQRAGKRLAASISHDGTNWRTTGVLTTEFPDKVQVGVHAIANSPRDFSVEFSDFTITRGRSESIAATWSIPIQG